MISDKTKAWWRLCLVDPEKLQHWLVVLYNNEKDAEERFVDFAETYCKNDKENYDLFMLIADQERQHATIVEELLKSREITLYEKSTKNGRYWRNTLPCICDIKTAAAIGAYAEGLSLMRMLIIVNDEKTPDDIRKMFEIIEPEESFHAKVLKRIATKYGMKAVKDCHDKGLEELGLKIKNG